MDVGFAVAQWEWLLILLGVLALAVYELVSLRRSQRRDREREGRIGR
ncbi:MAG: hypothetical protein U1F54_03055 [Burkholderiales bacterium]